MKCKFCGEKIYLMYFMGIEEARQEKDFGQRLKGSESHTCSDFKARRNYGNKNN